MVSKLLQQQHVQSASGQVTAPSRNQTTGGSAGRPAATAWSPANAAARRSATPECAPSEEPLCGHYVFSDHRKCRAMPCCQLPGLDHPISQHSHNAVILQQLRGDGPMAEPVWQNARARPRSAARQVLLTRLSRAHARTSSSSVHRAARAMAAQASAGSSERPCSAG